MLTKATVLCRKNTIRARELELPPIEDDELLVKSISNSICPSAYKTALLGESHKRVPDNISKHPPTTGHEFTDIIMEVGNRLRNRFQPGEKPILQPAMGLPGGYSAGYSYEYFGRNATYCIIPRIIIDLGCMFPYRGNYFANASPSEPMSCIIGAYHAAYHTKQYVYGHSMDVKERGKPVLMDCAEPMGIGAIDYVVNGPVSSRLTVATDIDERHSEHAHTLISEEAARKQGKTLVYIDTKNINIVSELRGSSRDTGFDDVFVFATVPALLKQADAVLGSDGYLNFFAGPIDKQFAVLSNFYNMHYEGTHIMGASDGPTQDMLECLTLSTKDRLSLGYMIVHVGELQAASEIILNLPNIPGGKKPTYPHVDPPLAVVESSRSRQSKDPLFKTLAGICGRNHNVWCEGAETYLLGYHQV